MTTIALLHGAYGAPDEWKLVRQALPEHLEVRAPALPGHDEPLVADDLWAATVDRVAERVAGVDVVAGYSLGARLALAAALVQPPRALVLVSGTAGLDDDAARAARVIVDDERAAAFMTDPDAFLASFWALPLFAGLAAVPERARLLEERRHRWRRRASALAPVLAGLSPGRAPSLWSALGRVPCPVWLVVGAVDDAYVAVARRMVAALPRATLRIVPGRGHALPLEAPEEVSRTILDACAAITPSASLRSTHP